jgi:pilus assembly protein Flp/PilA
MEIRSTAEQTLNQGEGSHSVAGLLLAPRTNGVEIMSGYMTTWLRLKTDRRGVTALEYGLIAALVAGVIITAVTLLGTNLAAAFNTVAGSV